jgi:hypothetical protein
MKGRSTLHGQPCSTYQDANAYSFIGISMNKIAQLDFSYLAIVCAVQFELISAPILLVTKIRKFWVGLHFLHQNSLPQSDTLFDIQGTRRVSLGHPLSIWPSCSSYPQ